MDPSGVLNYLMMTLHITSDKVSFLATRSIALQAVTLINIWSGYPFYMISILAGLQGISTDLYEASSLDGANTNPDIPENYTASVKTDSDQSSYAGLRLDTAAVRIDLDDHRRRSCKRNRDSQHLHL